MSPNAVMAAVLICYMWTLDTKPVWWWW